MYSDHRLINTKCTQHTCKKWQINRDDRKLYFGLFYTVLPKFIMQTRCSHNLLQFFGITLFEKNSACSNFETFCRSCMEYIKNTENII